MKIKNCFKDDESGAVTVDWVVLTSAIVGIGMTVIILISGGISNATSNISSGIGTSWNWNWNATVKNAQEYFDFGIETYPFDKNQAWLTAREKVGADAPDGYEYDPKLTTTRFVDNSSGIPIYVSDDGKSYSIGGDVISVDDYDENGSTAFKSVFDDYW